ncbi:glutathione S-transferase [Pararhodobacter marinus]|uniref:Glutathione S-transferase n=1 Tax=Pararhodobacter marinus TaxID=2184063 RepID=A0A2U2C4I8_9RHOB|nr:glutathione S-transferase family protein [Pararhodobacter marinus]PWE26798.1 glutathione S-transferase [Pararhodobacter marinus]
MIELWHSKDSRSLRALWTLEELGLDYRLHVLPFPPRLHDPDFTQINPLGTVPYFTDGVTRMTESAAIVHYLTQRHGAGTLAVAPEDPDYGDWLNWMYHADATLTFPQTLVLRYGRFEPVERRQKQVVEDYTQWFFSRLKLVNARLDGAEYLCAGRFTAADIAVGYALYLADVIGLGAHLKPQTRAWLERITARPAFARANAHGTSFAE